MIRELTFIEYFPHAWHQLSTFTEHESQCSFHPKFLPACWGKAASGSHPVAHPWASMALWARGPEPTIAVAHLQIKSCILSSQCRLCYHPYACLQLKHRPALCPAPGLALMTTYRGCLLISLVSHQRSSITLHSISSACHAPFLCPLVLSHQSPKIQAISHVLSEALANHLRPKWSLSPLTP